MKKLLIVVVLGIVLSLLSSCVILPKNQRYDEYYVRYHSYSDTDAMVDGYYVKGVDTVFVHESEQDFEAQDPYEPFIVYIKTDDLSQMFKQGSSDKITTIYKSGSIFYIKVSDIDLEPLKPIEIIGGKYATS